MTRPYNGPPKLNQLAHLRKDYKGKNMSGGRKCFFTQSKEYKRSCRYGHNWESGVTKRARPWCTEPGLTYFTPVKVRST